jgi:hypothetical protein
LQLWLGLPAAAGYVLKQSLAGGALLRFAPLARGIRVVHVLVHQRAGQRHVRFSAREGHAMLSGRRDHRRRF